MPAPKGHPPYNKNGEGGRPLELTKEELDKRADDLFNYSKDFIENGKVFWWKDWCFKNFYAPSEVKRWADSKRSERFTQLYSFLCDYQEQMVFKGGLIGKFASNFAKFYLCAHHNWTDKKIVEHQGNVPVGVVNFGEKEAKTWAEENK